MSINFSNILAFGFQKSEIAVINEYAISHDLILREFSCLDYKIFRNIPAEHIVLIKINDQNDIRQIKHQKLYMDNSLCIFCLELDKRNLLYSHINHMILPIFFSPIDINEIDKSFAKILSIRKRKDNFNTHIKGLTHLDSEFVWKTSDIKVSPLCSDIAKIMEIGNFILANETDGITLALEEAFTNSIEHGNLELDSNLRPQSYNDSDDYEKLRIERLNDTIYGNRLIKCRITADLLEIVIEIEDQGKGFDSSSFLKKTEKGLPSRQEILTSSGKGIILINKYFQKIAYTNNGKSIRLHKNRISKGGENGN